MSTDASLRSQLERVRHRLSWMEECVNEGQERRKDALLTELDAVLTIVAQQQSFLTAEVKARVSDTHAMKSDFERALHEEATHLQNTVRGMFASMYNTDLRNINAQVKSLEVQVNQVLQSLSSPTGRKTSAAARSVDDDSSDSNRSQCTSNTSPHTNEAKSFKAESLKNASSPSSRPTEGAQQLHKRQMHPAKVAEIIAKATDDVGQKIALVERDVSAFESLQMNDALALVDSHHRKVLQRLRHAKQMSQQSLQEGVPEHLESLGQLRVDLSTHAETTSATLDQFGRYLLNELALFAEAIQNEASLREEMDDHLVTVLNEWNKALQKGLVQAVNVE